MLASITNPNRIEVLSKQSKRSRFLSCARATFPLDYSQFFYLTFPDQDCYLWEREDEGCTITCNRSVGYRTGLGVHPSRLSVVMSNLGSTVKVALAASLLVGAIVACGDDGSTTVVTSPPPSPGPGSPAPSTPPPDDIDPEITFFELPTTEIERGNPVIIPAGSLITTTPRGLPAPPQAAFQVEIRSLSEGVAFENVSFFLASDAGCLPGDVVCTVQEIGFDIGPDAELDDYTIEITVFDTLNVSASATRTFTIVESTN